MLQRVEVLDTGVFGKHVVKIENIGLFLQCGLVYVPCVEYVNLANDLSVAACFLDHASRPPSAADLGDAVCPLTRRGPARFRQAGLLCVSLFQERPKEIGKGRHLVMERSLPVPGQGQVLRLPGTSARVAMKRALDDEPAYR